MQAALGTLLLTTVAVAGERVHTQAVRALRNNDAVDALQVSHGPI
jgi:hypothetical protein